MTLYERAMTTEGRVDCMFVVRFYGGVRPAQSDRRGPTGAVRREAPLGALTRTRARGRVESASFRGSPPSRVVS